MGTEALRRQPLFFTALFLAAGIALQGFLKAELRYILGLLALLVPLAALVYKRERAFLACLALIGVLFGAWHGSLSSRVPPHDVGVLARSHRGDVYLGGRIVSDIERSETSYGAQRAVFTLEAQKTWPYHYGTMPVRPAPATGRVKVYLTDPPLEPGYGDEVVVKGALKLPKGKRNPGGFDHRAYLGRQGIHAVLYASKDAAVRIVETGSPLDFQRKALEWKRRLSKGLSDYFSPRDAAFLKALFLGERSELEEDFKDLFIRTGTMHLLAVSGLHVGFLGMAVFLILTMLRLSRNARLLVLLGALWFYCLLIGWKVPVVRASVMASIVILGHLLGRKTNLLNALGLAGLLILWFSPKQLFDAGFQLSFLAVFGIVRFLPLFMETTRLFPGETLTLSEKTAHYFRELFWVSFIATVVTLPVTIQTFYIFSPYSVFTNLIAVPMVFLIFCGGLAFFLTFAWTPKVFVFVPWLLKTLIHFFVSILYGIENLPGSSLIVGRLNPILWVLLAGGTAYFLFSRSIRGRRMRAVSLILLVACVLGAQEGCRHVFRPFRMTVLDVGQGDSIYFQFPKGGNMLIDAGDGPDNDQGRWAVAPFLKSEGVRSIDALVMTHPHADHIGGMMTLLDQFRVRRFVGPDVRYESQVYGNLLKELVIKKVPKVWVKNGDRIEGFPGVEISVLNPDFGDAYPEDDINDRSVCLLLSHEGKRFFLTGDLGPAGMENLARKGVDLDADVLKVPHHGAPLGEGESFMQMVSPEISLVSVGERNRYGHPNEETMRFLRDLPGNRLYRTDRDAAITLYSDGKKIHVVTMNG